MRRFAFILLAAALFVPQAQAKEHPVIKVSAPPAHLKAGQPWNARISLLIDNGRPWDITGITPALELQDKQTAKRKTVIAHRVGTSNVFRARVVFPSKGSYLVTAWVDVDNPELPFTSFDAQPVAGTGGMSWLLQLVGALALAAALAAAALLWGRTRRRRARALATA